MYVCVWYLHIMIMKAFIPVRFLMHASHLTGFDQWTKAYQISKSMEFICLMRRVSEISGHAYSSEKITRCWRYNLSTMWNITTWQWEIVSGCRHSFQHNKHNTVINFYTGSQLIQIYFGHFFRMTKTWFEISKIESMWIFIMTGHEHISVSSPPGR